MHAFVVYGFLTVCSIMRVQIFKSTDLFISLVFFSVSSFYRNEKKRKKKITTRGDLINQWLSQRSFS